MKLLRRNFLHLAAGAAHLPTGIRARVRRRSPTAVGHLEFLNYMNGG
jgi:hypothetical protein